MWDYAQCRDSRYQPIFLTYYHLSVILLLKVKEESLAFSLLMFVV